MADQEQRRAPKRKECSSLDKLLTECRKERAERLEKKMALLERLVNATESKGTSDE